MCLWHAPILIQNGAALNCTQKISSFLLAKSSTVHDKVDDGRLFEKFANTLMMMWLLTLLGLSLTCYECENCVETEAYLRGHIKQCPDSSYISCLMTESKFAHHKRKFSRFLAIETNSSKLRIDSLLVESCTLNLVKRGQKFCNIRLNEARLLHLAITIETKRHYRWIFSNFLHLEIAQVSKEARNDHGHQRCKEVHWIYSCPREL